MYDQGITPVASLTMSSAVGFAALAYNTTFTSSVIATGLTSYRERNLYVAAALAAFGLAPYTQILMGSTNAELSRRATVGQEKANTHDLVKTWGRYNFVRGCMLLVSAGLGTWAIVS